MKNPITSFRPARTTDIDTIVSLLASDPLGKTRERVESPTPQVYIDAFTAIDQDPNNNLIVAEVEGRIVGVLQLTLIPNLTYQGSWRAQIEGVRVSADVREQGVGRGMVEFAIGRARSAGCRLIQLTTDKQRPDAIRFYEGIGFTSSHEGMKLRLD